MKHFFVVLMIAMSFILGGNGSVLAGDPLEEAEKNLAETRLQLEELSASQEADTEDGKLAITALKNRIKALELEARHWAEQKKLIAFQSENPGFPDVPFPDSQPDAGKSEEIAVYSQYLAELREKLLAEESELIKMKDRQLNSPGQEADQAVVSQQQRVDEVKRQMEQVEGVLIALREPFPPKPSDPALGRGPAKSATVLSDAEIKEWQGKGFTLSEIKTLYEGGVIRDEAENLIAGWPPSSLKRKPPIQDRVINKLGLGKKS